MLARLFTLEEMVQYCIFHLKVYVSEFKKHYYYDQNSPFSLLLNKELFILCIAIMISFLNDKCYITLMFVNLNVYNAEHKTFKIGIKSTQ